MSEWNNFVWCIRKFKYVQYMMRHEWKRVVKLLFKRDLVEEHLAYRFTKKRVKIFMTLFKTVRYCVENPVSFDSFYFKDNF